MQVGIKSMELPTSLAKRQKKKLHCEITLAGSTGRPENELAEFTSLPPPRLPLGG